MIKNEIKAVAQFHNAFGIDSKNHPTTDIPQQTVSLRYNLMKEENEEYLEAAQNNDLVEVADALGDMHYTLCGTRLTHGMQHSSEDVFAEMHESNMSKLGWDGKPICREDGKVMKGTKYRRPDLKQFLD